jgi:hypothetical protein
MVCVVDHNLEINLIYLRNSRDQNMNSLNIFFYLCIIKLAIIEVAELQTKVKFILELYFFQLNKAKQSRNK